MPRPPRHHLPGVPLHIIQRGNNRKPCFFNETDYTVYLDKLRYYAREYKVAIHSYVLMTNHVHLLLSPATTQGVSKMMQSLGRYYVRFVNGSYNRTGTLWEGRFKDSLVHSTQYLLKVSRYIEMNPVRAKMVEDPADYPWSSFQHNALGIQIKLITPHPVYLSLGESDSERQRNYCSLFKNEIPANTLQEIRSAINKSWVLGPGKFKREIEEQLGYPLPPFLRGGDRRSKNSRQL